jgi:hypothetical protein
MSRARARSRTPDDPLPPFQSPPTFSDDPFCRLGTRLLIALIRCGYASAASDFLEAASAAARVERFGRKPPIDSQTYLHCSMRAERYANECQALLLESAETAPRSAGHGAPLRIDLRRWRVDYRGREIATGGANGLTPQSVVILAALAKRAPDAISMIELEEEVERLAQATAIDRPVRRRTGMIRKYVLRNLRKAFLAHGVSVEEFRRLLEAPANGRLRLNLAAL